MIRNCKVIAQAYFVCAILSICCSSGKKTAPTAKAILVYGRTDLVDSSFKVISIRDSFHIVYYKDYTLYMTSLPSNFMKPETMPDGHIELREVVKTEMDTLYVVFRNKDSIGLRFSLNKEFLTKPVSRVEYFRHMSVAEGLQLFVEGKERIIRSGMHGDTLVEVSVPTVSAPSFSDTTFFYLVKDVNDKPYTFSAALEKLRGKKLVKVVSNWLPYYDSSLHHMIPARQFLFRRMDFDMDEEIAKKAVAYFTAHEELLKKPAGIMNKE